MAEPAPIQESLTLARRLVDALESGDSHATDDLVQALNDGRSEALFTEIGKLTRELHNTFSNLVADDRLMTLARQQMPDARDRLRYVIEKSEEAANRTLTAVEDMLPLADHLVQHSAALRTALGQDPACSPLADRVGQFLDRVGDDGRRLRSGLNEVLMAQEYQDLTGQVIKGTIALVAQVEGKLVELLTACGAGAAGPHIVSALDPATAVVIALGPVISDDEGGPCRQSEVDDLLANLGF